MSPRKKTFFRNTAVWLNHEAKLFILEQRKIWLVSARLSFVFTNKEMLIEWPFSISNFFLNKVGVYSFLEVKWGDKRHFTHSHPQCAFFLAQCCDCKSKSIAGPQPDYDYFVVQMSLEKLLTDLTLAVCGFILQLWKGLFHLAVKCLRFSHLKKQKIGDGPTNGHLNKSRIDEWWKWSDYFIQCSLGPSSRSIFTLLNKTVSLSKRQFPLSKLRFYHSFK